MSSSDATASRGLLNRFAVFLLGLAVGAGVAAAAGWLLLSNARSDVKTLQAEVAQLTAAARAVVPIEPGEGDNAPPATVWSGQTGRIRYAQFSADGFDYIVEMENMPVNKTLHVFWAIAPVGQNPFEHITKAGVITTDQAGRGTLSGLVPLPPGKYILGNFISDKDDPAPPYTHRTWLCIRTSASFEVFAKS